VFVGCKFLHCYDSVICFEGNEVRLVQGGSNMTGTNCDLFTHKSSRSYLNHLVFSSNLLPEYTNYRTQSFLPLSKQVI
jgi:hypothetical protein